MTRGELMKSADHYHDVATLASKLYKYYSTALQIEMESPGLRKECVEEVQATVEEFFTYLLRSVHQKLLTKFASPAVAEVGSLSSIFQLSISIFSPNPWSKVCLSHAGCLWAHVRYTSSDET